MEWTLWFVMSHRESCCGKRTDVTFPCVRCRYASVEMQTTHWKSR